MPTTPLITCCVTWLRILLLLSLMVSVQLLSCPLLFFLLRASIAPKKVQGFIDRERDKEKDRDSLNGELLQSSELRRGGVLSFLRGSPNA